MKKNSFYNCLSEPVNESKGDLLLSMKIRFVKQHIFQRGFIREKVSKLHPYRHGRVYVKLRSPRRPIPPVSLMKNGPP